MGERYSEEVSQIFAESLSQIESSFNHLIDSVNLLAIAMKEKNCFSADDFFIVEEDIEGIRDSVTKFKRLAEQKRRVLIIK
ncbi:hypothetical protein ABE288_18535 [Bacillus salipaludis]|uniref:hypothetical protein n=1 Tax=Bacillus salipaludis TaxID=2547811 RepID=UPI003D21673B